MSGRLAALRMGLQDVYHLFMRGAGVQLHQYFHVCAAPKYTPCAQRGFQFSPSLMDVRVLPELRRISANIYRAVAQAGYPLPCALETPRVAGRGCCS